MVSYKVYELIIIQNLENVLNFVTDYRHNEKFRPSSTNIKKK